MSEEGPEEGQFCMQVEKSLELQQAIQILENIDNYHSVSEPPQKPKGSEVYLFLPLRVEEQDNWKCDQYRWLNNGPKDMPRKGPLIRKQYYVCRLPKGKTFDFQRHVYELIGDSRSPKPMLIHYIGDHNVTVDFPHGNSRISRKPFYAVCPSVRKELTRATAKKKPSEILKTQEEEGSTVSPVMKARNKIQVRNFRRKQRLDEAHTRAPRAVINAMYDVASSNMKFVHYVQTMPKLLCVVGLPAMIRSLEDILQLQTEDKVVFSYSEPFKVGKFYVNVFMFSHIAFESKPAFPSHAMIYEDNDLMTAHQILLSYVRETVSSISEYQSPVLTCKNEAIAKSLEDVFPNLFHIYDWEQLIIKVRIWLRAHEKDIHNISPYTDAMRTLLTQPSREAFELKLEDFQESWSSEFKDFFEGEIRGEIVEHLGRWILEKYRVYSPSLGVTEIVSKDMQIIMRQIQDLKEPTPDLVVFAFYYLQLYMANEIVRGFGNTGSYKLTGSLDFLRRDFDELGALHDLCPPSDIVQNLRSHRLPSLLFCAAFGQDDDEVTKAKLIATSGTISHSIQQQAFMVRGLMNDLHVVTLYPEQYCSCGNDGQCCHVMAVKLCLGAQVTLGKRKATLDDSIDTDRYASVLDYMSVSKENKTETPQIIHDIQHHPEADGNDGITFDSFIQSIQTQEPISSTARVLTATTTLA